MGGAASSKVSGQYERAISTPPKSSLHEETDCKLRSDQLQNMALGENHQSSRSEYKLREYSEIKKAKSGTIEWNESSKLIASDEPKPSTPIKQRSDVKSKPAPPTKPRPPPNRPISVSNQPKSVLKGPSRSDWDSSVHESQAKIPSQSDKRIETNLRNQGGARIISKVQKCVDESSDSDEDEDSSTVYDWTLTTTQGPSTHPELKMSQTNPIVSRENTNRDAVPKRLIRTVSDKDDELIADFRLASESPTEAYAKPDIVPMLSLPTEVSFHSSGEFKQGPIGTNPPRGILPPRGQAQHRTGPPILTAGGPRGIPVRPSMIKTNTPTNRSTLHPSLMHSLGPSPNHSIGPSPNHSIGPSPNHSAGPSPNHFVGPSPNLPPGGPTPGHYVIPQMNRPPQERHHQVKETKDVKRNRAQIPSTLTHAKPTTGDWLKKRYIVNNYILLDMLGTGSYGEVKLCKDRTTDKLYAMKIFSKEMLKKRKGGNTSETYFEDIKREIAIMKKLSHPNVLKLFEVLDDPNVNKMYLVLEYMKRGDLIKFLKTRDAPEDRDSKESSKRKNSDHLITLSDAELKVIFTQVVSGVKYLHYQNIIHGDIKPQNILVGDDNLVKIADFGISKMLENGSAQKLVDAGGTPAFMAPELCSSSAEAFSGQLADIWAIGATMFMLRFGHPPFVASNVLALYNKILTEPLEFPSVPIDPGLRNLLVNMLEKDPNSRYNMDQITNHPWLRFAPRVAPTTALFAPQPEAMSVKTGKQTQVLQLPDQYFNEEAEAMKCPKKTVDKEEIYRSIGFGVEQNQHNSEDDQEAGDGAGSGVGDDDSDHEDIMATNWASDVFEQVDDADLESSDDDSVDDEDEEDPKKASVPPKVTGDDEAKKVANMDEFEQDRRSKEFKQKLIAKSSATNFLSSGGPLQPTSQSRSAGAMKTVDDPSEDETDEETESPQKIKGVGRHDSLDLGDLVEELSMNDFEDMMDTLAMRPASRVSHPHQPTNTPFLLENVVISSHAINVRSGLGGVAFSDQGCRRSQEDRPVLVVRFERDDQLVAETGHYDHLLTLSVAAVFDGHSGEACSEFLSKNFLKSLLMNQDFYSTKTVKQSMIETCSKIDSKVCKELSAINDSSGSTGVIVVYDGRSRRLTVANVGDSKCILCRSGTAIQIHRTHRVGDHEDEINRIKNAGGSVVNKRVNGVLAISRAFGDTAFKDENHIDSSLVVSSPEIYSEIVTPMTEFCVIASDGLWDVMEPQAVVNYIRDRINEKIGIETIIRDLVEESIEIGSIDNVTVIILIFHLDKIAPASCGLPTIDSMSNLQSVNNV